jgi:hypothetical protein
LTKYLFRCTINGGSGDIIRGEFYGIFFKKDYT